MQLLSSLKTHVLMFSLIILILNGFYHPAAAGWLDQKWNEVKDGANEVGRAASEVYKDSPVAPVTDWLCKIGCAETANAPGPGDTVYDRDGKVVGHSGPDGLESNDDVGRRYREEWSSPTNEWSDEPSYTGDTPGLGNDPRSSISGYSLHGPSSQSSRKEFRYRNQ